MRAGCRLRPKSESFKRSPPRVHCIPGHFERGLSGAHRAGMILWSPIRTADAPYSRLANFLITSSFGVSKDEQRDRLISWPRVQNDLLPEPPQVQLPSPDLFSRVREETSLAHGAFYFDIANMFHNIRLPPCVEQFSPPTARFIR